MPLQFSWYTRRVTLAGIYKMTELYMIQDKSADFEETWNFLGRRIEDVSHLHSYLHQSGEVSQVAKEAVASAFVTVCQYSDMFYVHIPIS
jgi:ubiquinone biosynthesis protein COQ9